MQQFVGHLLNDVQALEYMLDNDWFERDIVRIGAEQEMCIVDAKTYKPATINMAVLETMQQWEWVTTELAKFNLETNLTPREFVGDCLRKLENENAEYLALIRKQVQQFGADILLCGILPTLRKSDLDLSNLTPKPRYFALMEALANHLQGDGGSFELHLSGIDELNIKHDSPLLEACNTSYQVHLQVAPKDFARLYNIAQVATAPIISISANSPMVFGKRLWHESRIALFQQSLDTRTSHDHMRERSARVHFGQGFLKDSILEIYKEDIARFRVLLGDVVEEDSLKMVMSGKVPKLRALQIHNSTVYRWNRPCYGISPNGKPHLRIENRVIPAGPTTLDAAANSAFWLGMVVGLDNKYRGQDMTSLISFEDVRDNFDKAAKFGIDTKYTWLKDEKVTPVELIMDELLPVAKQGLASRNVDPEDIERYMSIIEGRALQHRNGARWQLRTFTKLKSEVTTDEALATMTASMVKNQWLNKPVHTWELPELTDLESYHPSQLKVEEFMQTDLFTVHAEDIVELVAQLMDWKKIRYMPVENNKGELVGLVTSRLLLRHFTQNDKAKTVKTVGDLMIKAPMAIAPEATLVEGLNMMQTHKIGCLPVVQGKELVGVITEMDFLRISSRLIQRVENKAVKDAETVAAE